MRRDLLCAVVLLAVAGVFWTQLDHRPELTAAFPDFVLIVLVLLAAGIAVRGVLRRGGPAEAAPEEGPPEGRTDLRFLAAAIALVVVWAFGMGLVGFTISGVLAFVVMAQLIRRGRPRPLTVAKDTGVAIVMVVACFLIFTEVLLVPLPVSVLIGM